MRRLPLVLLGAAVLAGAACGSGGRTGAPTDPRPTSTSSLAGAAGGAPSASSSIGAPSPLSFTAPGVHGGEVSGAALAGRDVVLWFWSPW